MASLAGWAAHAVVFPVYVPQVWTGQGRVITQIPQVPKGSVDCFRESVKLRQFVCCHVHSFWGDELLSEMSDSEDKAP